MALNLRGELTYLQEGKAESIRIVQGHDRGITTLIRASDNKGTALHTGSFDGRVCHWDIKTGTAAVVDGQSHTNQVAQLVGASGKAYSVGWDDTLRTVDESAKTFLGDSVILSAQPRGVAAAEGNVYVATTTGVAVYNNGKLIKETSTTYTPGAIAATNGFVAVGADQNSVKVYKTDASGALNEAQSLVNSTGTISSLAFSHDSAHLAAGNSVGKIYVYQVGSWEVVADRWSAHTARVTCITWDDTGAYAASGSLDTNVFIWCLEKKNQGKRIKAANAHKDGVSGVAWIEGGKLASAGNDATVKIWDVQNLP
ncbi:hypothetical protein NQ176_g11219 [Zarea fungicola]|uniref:Uncharacterized protein n=1 Tax=Zarea fungicola TaxID=93591 RepID=A0ACC1MBE5_9HYPO|nr:hypothetical protein NQ176_g11219 [Lecanicillium fungicola]